MDKLTLREDAFALLSEPEKTIELLRVCVGKDNRAPALVKTNLENIINIIASRPRTPRGYVDPIGSTEDIDLRLVGEGILNPAVRAWFIREATNPDSRSTLKLHLDQAQTILETERNKHPLRRGETNTDRHQRLRGGVRRGKYNVRRRSEST